MEAATDLTEFTDEIVSCGYTGLLKLDQKDSIIRSVFIFQRNYFYIINFEAHSISSDFNSIVLLLFLEMQHLNLKYTFVQTCLSLI